MKNKTSKNKKGLALWFKNHFIPHLCNNHRPHILHRSKVFRLLMILMAVEAVFFTHVFVVMPNINLIGAIMPAVLGNLTNEERVHNSLSGLQANSQLEIAATNKALDMADKSY